MKRLGRVGHDAPQRLLLDVSAAPTADAAPLRAPDINRHPHADREILLRGQLVAYSLKRVRRRSIGFMVGADGLSINVPKWIGLGDIEAALHEKGDWIVRKLAEQRERSQRMADARIDWRDGASIPFLGEAVTIAVDAQATADATVRLGSGGATLRLALPPAATPAQVRDAVQQWLKREARAIFEARCTVYAERVGVKFTRLQLSSARTRWGSASADGSIRLNWRLAHFPLALIDYVVVHELAHLREMNHSARFWSVVRTALPGFEAARDALKAGAVPMFD